MWNQYFGGNFHVSTYNKFRPSPPKSMIQEIIRFTSEKFSGPLEMAVDVGCGSGQSTEVFAPYFTNVLGIDTSNSIIEEARAKSTHKNITYSQASAEEIPVPDESVNLISVCQSLHWFDIPKFYEEANRILCKNGVLAVYGYRLPEPQVKDAKEELSTIVKKYYEEVLGNFVLPQSRKVYLENYTTKEFNEVSFVEGKIMKRSENFISEVDGTVTDLIGYISSWSTYQNYAKQVGEEKAQEILESFRADFNEILGNEIDLSTKFKIKYNYFLLIGRKI